MNRSINITNMSSSVSFLFLKIILRIVVYIWILMIIIIIKRYISTIEARNIANGNNETENDFHKHIWKMNMDCTSVEIVHFKCDV